MEFNIRISQWMNAKMFGTSPHPSAKQHRQWPTTQNENENVGKTHNTEREWKKNFVSTFSSSCCCCPVTSSLHTSLFVKILSLRTDGHFFYYDLTFMCANHSIDITIRNIVDVLSPKLFTIASIIIDMANDMAKNHSPPKKKIRPEPNRNEKVLMSLTPVPPISNRKMTALQPLGRLFFAPSLAGSRGENALILHDSELQTVKRQHRRSSVDEQSKGVRDMRKIFVYDAAKNKTTTNSHNNNEMLIADPNQFETWWNFRPKMETSSQIARDE